MDCRTAPAQTGPTQKLETPKYRPTAGLSRLARKQDHGRCQFRDEATGRQCTATHHLQIDHIQPYAWGGKTELKNLRLLCSAHHRLITQQQFGQPINSSATGSLAPYR